jgi:hypothetical protein
MENPISRQRFTVTETIVISICLFILLFGVVIGFINQSKVNADKIRIRNLNSITKILDSYYNDSSSVEYSRKFPISQCSTTEPNSVDFEHTLYLSLTGLQKNTTPYIAVENWPQDKSAEFISQTDNICSKSLPNLDQTKYSINNKECLFAPEKGKNFCYLYSTSPEGDRYTLSFFSDAKNKRVNFVKLRNNPVGSNEIDFEKELVL